MKKPKLRPEEQYPKLVRDNIPQIIEREGKLVSFHTEKDDSGFLRFLTAKLVEEANELSRARQPQEQIEELSDVREVLATIQKVLGLTESEIQDKQDQKKRKRGGFDGRIILDSLPK